MSGVHDGREAGGAHAEPFHLAGKSDTPRRAWCPGRGVSRMVAPGRAGGLIGGEAPLVADAAGGVAGRCSSPDVHRPPGGERRPRPPPALRLLVRRFSRKGCLTRAETMDAQARGQSTFNPGDPESHAGGGAARDSDALMVRSPRGHPGFPSGSGRRFAGRVTQFGDDPGCHRVQ